MPAVKECPHGHRKRKIHHNLSSRHILSEPRNFHLEVMDEIITLLVDELSHPINSTHQGAEEEGGTTPMLAEFQQSRGLVGERSLFANEGSVEESMHEAKLEA